MKRGYDWENYERGRFLGELESEGLHLRIVTHPLILEELTRLRDKETDRFKFRQVLRRMGGAVRL